MTDNDKALAARLFAMADEYDSGHHESWPTIDALEIAAHRIEALSAENERLLDIDEVKAKAIDNMLNQLANAEQENERIKDRLGWICSVMDLDDEVSMQWVYTELEALRGLGEQQ